MKLNCGKTSSEKSRIYWDKYWAKDRAKQDWHRVFCWLPTRMTRPGYRDYPEDTRDCRWLEFVEKRGTKHHSDIGGHFHSWYTWEFRPINNKKEQKCQPTNSST